MNFLFFDCECSLITKDKVRLCSFGYVLTDASLNVIKKEDLLINPVEFSDTVMNDVVAYSKEELLRSNKFPYFYNKIKELLEDKHNICVGQSVFMDAMYVNQACKQYNLEPINFPFYDLAEIYRNIYKNDSFVSLDLEASALSIGVNQGDKHTSENDAYITYLCVKKLSEKEKISPYLLIKKYKGFTGVAKKYRVLTYNNLLTVSNNMGNNSKNRKRFNTFARNIHKREKFVNQFLDGKLVYISNEYAKKHYKEMFLIVQNIKNYGGDYTPSKINANYFVLLKDEFSTLDIKNKKKNIRIELNEFLEKINFDESKVENYYNFVVRYDLLLTKEEKSIKNTIKSDGIKHLKRS